MQDNGGARSPDDVPYADESEAHDAAGNIITKLPKRLGATPIERVGNTMRVVGALLDRLSKDEREETLYRMVANYNREPLVVMYVDPRVPDRVRN
jgi:hypothetical protein